MAEPTQFVFSLEELTQALLKQQNIHEGIWNLAIEFSFTAATAGPKKEELYPTALIGVNRVGLTKTTEAGPLSFDASKLNPQAPRTKATAKKSSKPKAA